MQHSVHSHRKHLQSLDRTVITFITWINRWFLLIDSDFEMPCENDCDFVMSDKIYFDFLMPCDALWKWLCLCDAIGKMIVTSRCLGKMIVTSWCLGKIIVTSRCLVNLVLLWIFSPWICGIKASPLSHWRRLAAYSGNWFSTGAFSGQDRPYNPTCLNWPPLGETGVGFFRQVITLKQVVSSTGSPVWLNLLWRPIVLRDQLFWVII